MGAEEAREIPESDPDFLPRNHPGVLPSSSLGVGELGRASRPALDPGLEVGRRAGGTEREPPAKDPNSAVWCARVECAKQILASRLARLEAPELDARRQTAGFAHRIAGWAALSKSLTNWILSVIWAQ